MPSSAYQNFKNKNLIDVQRMVDGYIALYNINGRKKGKRALDHITRSGVLLLSAAWEVYIEEILENSVEYFLKSFDTPLDLPKKVRKHLSSYILEYSNPLIVAGEGWRKIYRDSLRREVSNLNTPKPEKVDPMFEKMIGTPISQIWNKDELINFMRFRGGIAHKVKAEQYVYLNDLEHFIAVINKEVIKTEKFLYNYLFHYTEKCFKPEFVTIPIK